MSGHRAGDYYLDAVGRRRKLSAGAMRAIRYAYFKGAPSRELAKEYRVSTSLIRTIVYSTPREADLRRLNMEPKFPG